MYPFYLSDVVRLADFNLRYFLGRIFGNRLAVLKMKKPDLKVRFLNKSC